MNQDQELAQSAAEEGCLTSTVMVGLAVLTVVGFLAVRSSRRSQRR